MASAGAKSAAQQATKDLAVLKLGADALFNRATSQIEQARSPSPSQGTEHVALRAIEVVSNKDTPAQRAAICHQNSPF